MPTFAQGNSAKVKYVAEVTQGTTPAAAMTLLNATQFQFDPSISTTTSQSITTTGADRELVRTAGLSDGSINFELQFTEFNPFLAAGLGGSFSTEVDLTATDISAALGDNSFNSVAAAFSTANILPGMWIRVKGFATAANNGIFKVVSVTTAKIIVSGGTLVTEAAGPSVNVYSKSVRNGTQKPSFSFEREFNDIGKYCVHRGCVVDTISLDTASGAIITGSFGFKGMSAEYANTTFGTGPDVAAQTTGILSGVANVGTIFENGTALTGVYFKSINLATNKNSRTLDAVGNLFPVGVNTGTLNVTATTSAYFSDTSLLDKYLNGTATSLSWSLVDDAGNRIVIDLPYCKIEQGAVDAPQLNSDIMQNLTFRGLVSPTLGYAVQISVLEA